MRKRDWTFDWRHKESFNNADHRLLHLVGSRFERVHSEGKRGLCTIFSRCPHALARRSTSRTPIFPSL